MFQAIITIILIATGAIGLFMVSRMNKSTEKQMGLMGTGAILVVGLFMLGVNAVSTNNFGEYVVKQSVTGEMSVKIESGIYPVLFSKTHTNKKADMFYFSKDKLDGGEGAAAAALSGTFQGNSTAEISGALKFILPSTESKCLNLHEKYNSNEAIKMDLVRNAVANALKQASPMFRPEEAFITKRSEYTSIVREILEYGMFETISEEIVVQRDGKDIKMTITEPKLDSNGLKVIKYESPFKKFGIVIEDFVIKDFDFDATTDALIKKKKKAEMAMIESRAIAEKAKQDAITAEEKGKAKIAETKAEEEVSKIREETIAEKEKAVAILNAQREKDVATLNAKRKKEVAALDAAAAIQEKKAMVTRAQAKKQELQLAKGLSEYDKYRMRMEKETQIGVAAERSKFLSGVKFIAGGGSGSGGADGAIATKLYLNMQKDLE